jgi:hypothetical protein
MATYYARKAGNINASDVWATTPTGTAAAVTFASGDVLMANGFTITVNVSTTVAEFRNDTTSGATLGGSFTLNAGVTMTGNLYTTTGASSLVSCSIILGTSATIVANTIQSNSSSGNLHVVSFTGAGTLDITAGIIQGGLSSSAQGAGLFNTGSGTLNVTASIGIYGGSGSQAIGVMNNSGGNIIITGNVYAGASSGVANGASSIGTITIIGSCYGSVSGSSVAGAVNTGSGMLIVTRAVGNAFGAGSSGLASSVGVANTQSGMCFVQEVEYGTRGQSPTSGPIFLTDTGTNVAVFRKSSGIKTLIDATASAAMPAATDVRSGVSYASGAATGSCAVPAAGSVALGVPVDAGYGTAVLTPEAVWGHASRTITGGTVTTLTNAPTVPTASAIASQVRTELSVELNRVDQAISTRATPANIPAADITAIKAKTDALVPDRLAQCSTVATTGAQLAAALS